MNHPSNHRVLVIDDNSAIQGDFRKILCCERGALGRDAAEFFGVPAPASSRPRFEIDCASQGSEGVAMVRGALEEGHPYAMAFVDVRMPPGIDGVETAKLLWEVSPDLQIVICTAYSDYSWSEMTARLGNCDRWLVLKKPFAAVQALQLACSLCAKWSLAKQSRDHLSVTELAVQERTRELREMNHRLETEMEERKKAEVHLLRAQRLESIGTLASGIAHDLNNVLSPILMAAGLLRDDVPEHSLGLLATIDTCAHRAAEVVKQVLTFARGIEGERLPLQPKLLVRELEKMIAETFPRQITIVCPKPGEIPLVQGDHTQLHQVLLNLCVNARDAMPDGGTLRIEIEKFAVDASEAGRMTGARVGDFVRFRVADTGSGIPPHLIDKIFDPFFTTKPLGEGTGLGLSTAIGIVKSHGGFLDITTCVGKGTTFDIFLPVAGECGPVLVEKAESAMPHGHGELILVVDDEITIREVARSILSQHGYRTLGAADGAEALTLYASQKEPIHAVFTDVMMPIVDGVILSRALKKMNPAVRIVAASGSRENEQIKVLHALPVATMLPKPFTAHSLLTAIAHALQMETAGCPTALAASA